MDWETKLSLASSPIGKRVAYYFLRPAFDVRMRRVLSTDMRSLRYLQWVLPERGLPVETRRDLVRRSVGVAVGSATILVQGTGNGWDVMSWANAGCTRIVGLDRFYFGDGWRNAVASNAVSVHTAFAVASSEEMPIRDRSVDVVASDAVYEHCRDFDAVLRDTYRVLRPGGIVYASYGPLWYCWGGDHVTDVGGLDEGYSHLEMDREAYAAFVADKSSSRSDAQAGLRYFELDLFSRLTTHGYLEAYERSGFSVETLILEISGYARQFRRRWPERFSRIASSSGVTEDDLLLKGHVVILRKPLR